MSESDNVEANVRHDLRAVEFSFLDSKNICCGLCGEIVLYDLLLSSHIPQHHPEVMKSSRYLRLQYSHSLIHYFPLELVKER